MKRLWISLIAAGLLVVAAAAPVAADYHDTVTDDSDGDNVTVDLHEADDSGATGTASLTGENGQTMISIEISGGPEGGVHPVHIHDGTCEDLGGVAYPLEDIENGMSESTVDVALDDLLAGDYAINAHLSADEMGTHVVCGNLVSDDAERDDDDAAMEEDDDAYDDAEDVVPATGSTGGVDGSTAALVITMLAAAMMATGILVRRRTQIA